ncbi:hypothetical protein M5D96_012115 [Drosophila gunungcola]|uniref:Uncharacterized protein n=1 Tax=Drosophila gunungcola TaxID=103775 RepID=A0A9P9YDT6_9MUSC|nr:hypothetical protein M5D96_012115 [Drosophila gunungcola]
MCVNKPVSLMDKPTRFRVRPVRSAKNIAAECVCTSLQRILTKDLSLKPYKVQIFSSRNGPKVFFLYL